MPAPYLFRGYEILPKQKLLNYIQRNLQKFLVILLLLTLGLSFYKKLFVFSLLIIAAGMLEYALNKGQIKLNLGHVLFLALLWTKLQGSVGGILIIVLAGFMPQLLIGNLDLRSLILYPLQILSVLLAGIFNEEFMLMAMFLVLACYGLTFILAKSFGDPLPELVLEVLLPMVMNIFFLSTVQMPLSGLVSMVIGS